MQAWGDSGTFDRRNDQPEATSGTYAQLPEPSASSRSSRRRNERSPAELSGEQAGSAGRVSWRDEPDDKAEWQVGDEDGWEDEDGDLLSRRFGGDGGGGQGGGGRGGRASGHARPAARSLR